jgi:hypothetical protein
MRTISGMLVLLGVLASGCGGSGSSSGTAARASRAASVEARVTRSQSIAYARQVNLTAADVPGAVVSSSERETGAPSQESVEFARCAGAANPARRVADIKSATFKTGKRTEVTQLKSSVETMPNAALAAQDYDAARSPRGHACLVRLLPRVLSGTTARAGRFGPATTSFLPDLLPAGQKSFGVRVTTSLTAIAAGRQTRVPVYLDIFEILAGPAEVSLTATSVSQPARVATERRLLSLLYSRAQAHKL